MVVAYCWPAVLGALRHAGKAAEGSQSCCSWRSGRRCAGGGPGRLPAATRLSASGPEQHVDVLIQNVNYSKIFLKLFFLSTQSLSSSYTHLVLRLVLVTMQCEVSFHLEIRAFS